MTFRTNVLFLMLAALEMGCGGPSSRQANTASTPEVAHPSRSGTHGTLRGPEAYAETLDAAERYWWQQPERVIDWLDCKPGMTVVDLGAGTGYFLPYLSRAVGSDGHVLAIDAAPSAIELLTRRVARSRLDNVDPMLVPADDPSLRSSSVDRVLVVHTWHHLSERVAYAEKLFRAVRPGGLILVVEFDRNSPKGPPAHMRLSPDKVRAELESAGFTTELVEGSIPYQYAVRAQRP
jgi:ubiquinone/menaquinone biosynthesis C-methylase UbiE